MEFNKAKFSMCIGIFAICLRIKFPLVNQRKRLLSNFHIGAERKN